jgi:prepilin-type N-terminal cleavage/methylation domain-containing protein
MKPGFSLIEIVIALMLASMISLVLYTSFEQTKRVTRKIESLEQESLLGMLTYHQLERDLAGVCIPESFLNSAIETSTTNQKKESENNKLDTVFRATLKGEEKELTFITTNPLVAYQEIKPRLVRVMYRIIPSAVASSFVLQRRESKELDLEKFLEHKEDQNFVIMENIKEITLNFITLDNTAKEKKQEFKTWRIEELKEVKKVLPNYVWIEGMYEDSITHKEHNFSFVFFISAADSTVKPEEKKPSQKVLPVMPNIPNPRGR